MEWRLIVDAPAHGAWNMAVDEALAEAVDTGASPPVLRLYRWAPPCLSLGFAQPYAAADAAFCAAHAIDVVRRPTGGRAVLHHLELTYAVCAPLGRPPFSRDLQAAYQAICGALVAGLRRLGVAAELSGAPAGGMIKPTAAIPCFIGPAAGEVVVGERKLIGSAMRRTGDSILQHGSILEGWDGFLQAGCLGLADDRELRPAVVTLADLLGAVPSPGSVAAAIADGFRDSFGVTLAPSSLGMAESSRAKELERERHANPRWTIHRERPAGSARGDR
jgi:lipoate-protein ligase A